jgi:hypothetical protein
MKIFASNFALTIQISNFMKLSYKIGIIVVSAALIATTLFLINNKKSIPEDDYLWIMW